MTKTTSKQFSRYKIPKFNKDADPGASIPSPTPDTRGSEETPSYVTQTDKSLKKQCF